MALTDWLSLNNPTMTGFPRGAEVLGAGALMLPSLLQSPSYEIPDWSSFASPAGTEATNLLLERSRPGGTFDLERVWDLQSPLRQREQAGAMDFLQSQILAGRPQGLTTAIAGPEIKSIQDLSERFRQQENATLADLLVKQAGLGLSANTSLLGTQTAGQAYGFQAALEGARMSAESQAQRNAALAQLGAMLFLGGPGGQGGAGTTINMGAGQPPGSPGGSLTGNSTIDALLKTIGGPLFGGSGGGLPQLAGMFGSGGGGFLDQLLGAGSSLLPSGAWSGLTSLAGALGGGGGGFSAMLPFLQGGSGPLAGSLSGIGLDQLLAGGAGSTAGGGFLGNLGLSGMFSGAEGGFANPLLAGATSSLGVTGGTSGAGGGGLWASLFGGADAGVSGAGLLGPAGMGSGAALLSAAGSALAGGGLGTLVGKKLSDWYESGHVGETSSFGGALRGGGSGAASGALAGFAVGGPVGALIGAILGGLGGGFLGAGAESRREDAQQAAEVSFTSGTRPTLAANATSIRTYALQELDLYQQGEAQVRARTGLTIPDYLKQLAAQGDPRPAQIAALAGAAGASLADVQVHDIERYFDWLTGAGLPNAASVFDPAATSIPETTMWNLQHPNVGNYKQAVQMVQSFAETLPKRTEGWDLTKRLLQQTLGLTIGANPLNAGALAQSTGSIWDQLVAGGGLTGSFTG